jgi:hypothetical protein
MATATLTNSGGAASPMPPPPYHHHRKDDQQRCIKLVGKRLKVRYTNGLWYAGVVRQWNSRRGHFIAFDDGDVLWTKDARVELNTLNCAILGPDGKADTASLLSSPYSSNGAADSMPSPTCAQGSPPAAHVVRQQQPCDAAHAAKRKSPLPQRVKADAASAPPPTCGQGSPPADDIALSPPTPVASGNKADAKAGSSSTRKRSKRAMNDLVGGDDDNTLGTAGTVDQTWVPSTTAATTTPSRANISSSSTATTTTTAITTAAAAANATNTAEDADDEDDDDDDTATATTGAIPACIPRTASGQIIGIRTTQPALPPAPPHFSTSLSSPLCDASVIVAHQPSAVREALDRLHDQSVHLPVAAYLDQLITLFACIDSVIPLCVVL